LIPAQNWDDTRLVLPFAVACQLDGTFHSGGQPFKGADVERRAGGVSGQLLIQHLEHQERHDECR
jgi:hypothetical protein